MTVAAKKKKENAPRKVRLRHEIIWVEEVEFPAKCPKCGESTNPDTFRGVEFSVATYDYEGGENHGCEELPETLTGEEHGLLEVRCGECLEPLLAAKTLMPTEGDEMKNVLALAAVMEDARKERA